MERSEKKDEARGRRFKAARAAAKLTQKRAAELAEVAGSTVYRSEAGYTVELEQTAKLARLYKVSIDELMDGPTDAADVPSEVVAFVGRYGWTPLLDAASMIDGAKKRVTSLDEVAPGPVRSKADR